MPEPLSLYARVKQFLGIGPNVSKARKALVSLILTLSYSFLQVRVVRAYPSFTINVQIVRS